MAGSKSRSRSRSRGRMTVRRPVRTRLAMRSRSRSRSASLARSESRGRSRSRSDVRRRRPPSRSVSRPRVMPRLSGGEYSRIKFRVGSVQRAPGYKQLSKLCLTRRILRWQGVNPLNRGPDAVGMGKYLCGAEFIGNSIENQFACRLPVYVFNLTGTINANVSSEVGHRLGFTSGGQITFDPVDGSSSGAGATRTWTTEWASDFNGAAAAEHRYVEQKWYDIRLMLRNATAQPTVWTVQIVSFADEHVDPYNIMSGGSNYGTSYQQQDAKAFWTNLAKADVSNPILPGGAAKVTINRLVVHKTVRVVMDPDSTVDEDKFPKTKEVRIMFNDNRVLDYQEYSPAPDNTNLFTTDTWTAHQTGVYRTNPVVKARRYLLVRAMDPTVSSVGTVHPNNVVTDDTVDAKNTPSFDVVIRKKEVVRPF